MVRGQSGEPQLVQHAPFHRLDNVSKVPLTGLRLLRCAVAPELDLLFNSGFVLRVHFRNDFIDA